MRLRDCRAASNGRKVKRSFDMADPPKRAVALSVAATVKGLVLARPIGACPSQATDTATPIHN